MREPTGFPGSERGILMEPPTGDGSANGGSSGRPTWADVPWKTIVATVGIVVATYLTMQVVLMTVRILAWIAVAAFFAIVLSPAVRRVEPMVGGRRNVATGIVVVSTLGVVIGALSLFLLPVRTQLINIITDLPGTIQDAANGRGPIGNLVTKLHLNSYVQDHERELTRWADSLSSSSFQLVTTLVSGLIAFVTITVLAFFFLSQASVLGKAVTSVIPVRRRESVRRVAVDSGQAISGYMVGNLLISLIAGTAAFICLVALGVPSAIVLALWVAVADLIPLVGAIIGAAVAVVAAFLESSPAGIVALIFFVVYQQVESSVLYPWIMSRRVKVNPLGVLLSFLLGVEMFGWIGALLAVPVSGAIGVAVKEINQEFRREKLVLPIPVEDPAASA
jgi:predicted PurR-regulated permease PerM